MAQIKSYDAGNLALKPTEIGVESTAAAGRREGTFFNQLGAGQQELGRDEGALGRETGQLGREVGGFAREIGHETAQLGSLKAHALTEWGKGLGGGIEAGGAAAVAYQTSKDISTGSKAFADFTLAKQKELNETLQNADPNDPSVVQNFVDGLNADLEKLKGSGFVTDKGQQWAQAHADHIRNTFQAQAQAGISTMARAAFINNQRGEMNSLSQAAYEGHPLPELIGNLESGVAAKIGSSPNLKGPDAAGLHGKVMQQGVESLVKAGVQGHIDRTGQVPEWINDPQYAQYVNAAELHAFSKSAQAAQRSLVAQGKAAKAYDRQQANDRATADVNRVWADSVTIDGVTGQPSIKPDYFPKLMKAIKDNPDAPNAAALGRTYLNWGESQLKRQNAITNPETKAQFIDRIGDPDNPLKVTDLMQAQMEGKLSAKDFGQMRGLITQLEKETFRDPAYKSAMDAAKSFLGTDPVGKGKYADFQAQFMVDYARERRAGTLKPNALDTTDPTSMISTAMKPHRRDLGQIMTDRAMRGTNVGTPGAVPPPAIEPGTVRNGWRYRDGDPSKPSSWERVQASGPVIPQSR